MGNRLTPLSMYRSLSGEVESRNVQKRLNMTPEERRASLAAETEDVAREDQIFLFGEDGEDLMGSEMRNSAPPARSVAQDIYNNEVEDTWIYFFRFGHFICCAEIFSTFEADFAEALSAYFWEKKKHSLLFAFSQERRKLIWNNKHGNNK